MINNNQEKEIYQNKINEYQGKIKIYRTYYS